MVGKSCKVFYLSLWNHCERLRKNCMQTYWKKKAC